MRFFIRRTSAYSAKPVPEATEVNGRFCVDRRAVDDPAKVAAYLGQSDWWYGKGTNHRVENGQICRDMKYQAGPYWAVEIEDLNALLALVLREGEVIVSQTDGNFELEIYDDWRE